MKLSSETLEEGTKRRIVMTELYRDLVLSSVNESMSSFLSSLLKLVDSHNSFAPYGKLASKQSIISMAQDVTEEMEGKITDGCADIIVDLQRALEEYEHEST